MDYTTALQQRRPARQFHRQRRKWDTRWSPTTTVVAVVVLAVASALAVVDAFPGAAGACPPNIAAVSGETSHGAASAIEKTLAQAGVSITVHPPELVAFQSAVVTLSSISASSNTTFRGFLLRMESQNDDEMFTFEPFDGSSSIQDAVVCLNIPTIAGLTHSFNDEKTIVAAEFVPSRAGKFLLDVTVVESNNAQDGSRYSYEQLVLTAAAADFDPTTNATANITTTSAAATDWLLDQISTERATAVPASAPVLAAVGAVPTIWTTTATVDIITTSAAAPDGLVDQISTAPATAVPASVPVPAVGSVPTISTFPPTMVSGSPRANGIGRWLLCGTAVVVTLAVMSSSL